MSSFIIHKYEHHGPYGHNCYYIVEDSSNGVEYRFSSKESVDTFLKDENDRYRIMRDRREILRLNRIKQERRRFYVERYNDASRETLKAFFCDVIGIEHYTNIYNMAATYALGDPVDDSEFWDALMAM